MAWHRSIPVSFSPLILIAQYSDIMQWDVKDLGLHKNALLQNAYDFNKK